MLSCLNQEHDLANRGLVPPPGGHETGPAQLAKGASQQWVNG
jgi:hypothetical protein